MANFSERVLILCKTYPSPSSNYAETSCVAGITESGKLIRLFPVPFRMIADEQQFRKWQWITALVEKARDDHRPESHRVFVDKIERDPEAMPSGKVGWPVRMTWLNKAPIYSDFAAVEEARQASGATLALLRPARIKSLRIRPTKSPTWTDEEVVKLTQMQRQSSLFTEEGTKRDVALLEKIPFDFHYLYECEVDGQTISYEHKLVDWEVGALYRKMRKEHGVEGWEERFRQKYERELPSKDLLLLLGTIHRFPDQWLIISVFSPPKPPVAEDGQGALF